MRLSPFPAKAVLSAMNGPTLASVDSEWSEAYALSDRVFEHFDRHRPQPESFPLIASKVVDTAEQPDVDATKLSTLIECDSAICTAVLAMANSAANRPMTPITQVQIAVARLGLRDVTNIAVGVACRSLFDLEVRVQNDLFTHWWERLFHSAMAEAFTCDAVAQKVVCIDNDGVFLSGLLHDVGKSLGLRSLAGLIVSGQEPPVRDDTMVERVLGHNRAKIGAIALERYGLPESLVTLCRSQDQEDLAHELKQAHILRLVSSLNTLRLGTLDTEHPIRMLRLSAQALSLEPDAVVSTARLLCDEAARVGVLFSTSDDSDESGFLQFLDRCLAA